MYKIEKNIPIPENPRSLKYPFREMEIGDSFFVSDEDTTISSVSSYFGKRNPEYKFTVRKVKGGHRVWRIKKDKA